MLHPHPTLNNQGDWKGELVVVAAAGVAVMIFVRTVYRIIITIVNNTSLLTII
jgi:hypothetical protein